MCVHNAAQRLTYSPPPLRMLLLQLLYPSEQPSSSNVCHAYCLYCQRGATWAAAGIELEQYTFSPAAVQLGLLIFQHNQLLLLLACLTIHGRLLFDLLSLMLLLPCCLCCACSSCR
jgi:hypothetical protein